MSEDCVYCGEPIEDEPARGVIYHEGRPRYGHRECALREALGGIGHLIAHDYWCPDDPDAGLTYRQSALLVTAWVEVVGMREATKRISE